MANNFLSLLLWPAMGEKLARWIIWLCHNGISSHPYTVSLDSPKSCKQVTLSNLHHWFLQAVFMTVLPKHIFYYLRRSQMPSMGPTGKSSELLWKAEILSPGVWSSESTAELWLMSLSKSSLFLQPPRYSQRDVGIIRNIRRSAFSLPNQSAPGRRMSWGFLLQTILRRGKKV